MAKLMAEAADELMPTAHVEATVNKDVFDILLQNVRVQCCTFNPQQALAHLSSVACTFFCLGNISNVFMP